LADIKMLASSTYAKIDTRYIAPEIFMSLTKHNCSVVKLGDLLKLVGIIVLDNAKKSEKLKWILNVIKPNKPK
jgi:hypothetical protein